jgi:hypothetical protein
VGIKFQLMLFILLWSSTTLAQGADAKGPLKPLDVIVADLLQASNVPGGIEVLSGCDQLKAKTREPETLTTDAALSVLSEAEHTLAWSKKGNLYSVRIREVDTPSVTSVQLPALQLNVTTLAQATDILLQHQATRNHLARIKMSETTDAIGFSSIHERNTRSISLPAGTLRDDLNAVALAFGKAIWRLDQRECGGDRIFRLSWISK